MLIAVPTGVKFFNWIGTMWGGTARLQAARCCSRIGFLLTFLIGGLTGLMLASAPLDFHLTDSYFVVAHFHYVLFGGSVFGMFAAVYYWFPKITGRMLDERSAGALLLTFVGFHLTFLVQHILGLDGMPRRVATLPAADGLGTLNLISSIGAVPARHLDVPVPLERLALCAPRRAAAGDNPWDGQTLEWATPSPPPPENLDGPLPPIRSERPVWDVNHPRAPVAERPRRQRPGGGHAVSPSPAAKVFVRHRRARTARPPPAPSPDAAASFERAGGSLMDWFARGYEGGRRPRAMLALPAGWPPVIAAYLGWPRKADGAGAAGAGDETPWVPRGQRLALGGGGRCVPRRQRHPARPLAAPAGRPGDVLRSPCPFVTQSRRRTGRRVADSPSASARSAGSPPAAPSGAASSTDTISTSAAARASRRARSRAVSSLQSR